MKFFNILKVTTLFALTLLMYPGVTLGQGTITFQNSATTLVLIDYLSNGNLVPATSTVYGTRIQLYYQPGTVSQPGPINLFGGLGAWQPIGNLSTIASNGRFSQTGLLTGADVAPGGSVWLEVLGWNGGFANYGLAQSGAIYFGASSVFQLITGGGGLPPSPPATTSGLFTGLTLINPDPEPSTMALMGVGAAALVWFRRRK